MKEGKKKQNPFKDFAKIASLRSLRCPKKNFHSSKLMCHSEHDSESADFTAQD